jgi:hypothetical protein
MRKGTDSTRSPAYYSVSVAETNEHLRDEFLMTLKRGKRRFQDVLINAVDYAAGRDFCPATSAARFHGSSSSMRLIG